MLKKQTLQKKSRHSFCFHLAIFPFKKRFCFAFYFPLKAVVSGVASRREASSRRRRMRRSLFLFCESKGIFFFFGCPQGTILMVAIIFFLKTNHKIKLFYLLWSPVTGWGSL